MPKINLTDRFVRGVRSDTRQNYFDTKVTGLNLRVAPSGRKTWHFVYRVPGKGPQWATLGTYPAASLADARKAALKQRKAVEVDGADPVAERKAMATPPPTAFTFADMAALYLGLAKRNKKTWKDDEQKIHRYLRPAWGTRPLREITRADVNTLLDTLEADGMTVGLNRMQALISRIFVIALDRSKVDAHPAARMIRRVKERPGDRKLTEDEIRDLWTGLDAHPGPAADAVRLRLLLGQRGAEINGMRWQDVDLDAGVWQLSGEMTKTGEPHTVALPPSALDVLTRRRTATADDETDVFPGLSLQSAGYRALSELHQGQYRWGDLRRTLATGLGNLGFSETVIGRVLNHAKYTVTGKHYAQSPYLAETRAALDAWDEEIDRILHNRKKRKKGSVVAFRGRG